MKNLSRGGGVLLIKVLSIFALLYTTTSQADQAPLIETMRPLDTAVFEAFNHCKDPKELAKHASYFDEAVEFYHDNGGVTWTREAMIGNTQKNACGNYTRKLVAESFNAYPINDFGAITEGVHYFCKPATKECHGQAKFVMVWHNKNGEWKVTRVLSYGHIAN